jgi:hypothetical protein
LCQRGQFHFIRVRDPCGVRASLWLKDSLWQRGLAAGVSTDASLCLLAYFDPKHIKECVQHEQSGIPVPKNESEDKHEDIDEGGKKVKNHSREHKEIRSKRKKYSFDQRHVPCECLRLIYGFQEEIRDVPSAGFYNDPLEADVYEYPNQIPYIEFASSTNVVKPKFDEHEHAITQM